MTESRAKDDAASVRDWIITYLSRKLDMDKHYINLGKGLGEYGFDSVDAVIMLGELEQYLGTEIDPSVVFEYDTLQEMLDAWERSGRSQ